MMRLVQRVLAPFVPEGGTCERHKVKLCCGPGQAGILVAPLTAVNQFLGYAGDEEQSQKKLLRDVLKVGDVYFNTGDLLLQDSRGFLYFHDRIGDTFRYLSVSRANASAEGTQRRSFQRPLRWFLLFVPVVQVERRERFHHRGVRGFRPSGFYPGG